MPRAAEPAVRDALVEHAAAMLAAREPVTLRALATRVGTSTMAVYTHFGGMDGLWAQVRAEGFRRLRDRLATVEHTDDPVRDLGALAAAYAGNALEHPALYRAMFDAVVDLAEPEVADSGFALLVDAARRAHEAGRTGGAAPDDVATRAWAAGHGLLMLVLTGVLPPDAVDAQAPALVVGVLAGAGGARDDCAASVHRGWTEHRAGSTSRPAPLGARAPGRRG